MTLKPTKLGQFFLVWNEGSLVRLCVQDYKHLCVAVTICATLVYPKLTFTL